MSTVDILFEDDDLLVVNKPSGLGTQAPRQFDSLEARVRKYLQSKQPESPYLGIPHRLDRCVSGVVLFAKRKKAAQRLSRQFEKREIDKSYLGLISGKPEQSNGTWRDTMRKVPDEPRSELVDADHADAKAAVLHYRVSRSNGLLTLLEIKLETGRMHQIRLQCSARGHAILGDRLYGSEQDLGPPIQAERERQIALHAQAISCRHPRSKEKLDFQVAPPAVWLDLLAGLT